MSGISKGTKNSDVKPYIKMIVNISLPSNLQGVNNSECVRVFVFVTCV